MNSCPHTKANTVEFKAMRAQDLERRERVMEMVAANELHAAEDYDHAAHILNHGDASEWLRQALKRWCGRKTLN